VGGSRTSNQPLAARKDPREQARHPINPRSTPQGGCIMTAHSKGGVREPLTTSQVSRYTSHCAHRPPYAHLLIGLGGSASPQAHWLHRQPGSAHSKRRGSSSARYAPHGPCIPSPRRGGTGVGLQALTPPPGTMAQTPSTTYASRQRMGHA
jgi:hypothetical protein